MNENGLAHAIQALGQAVASVPLPDLPRLIGDLECLKATADLRMRTGTQSASPAPTAAGEVRYLTVKEVAERFHVMPKWLYRHKKQMPYSQPSRKVLLFPEQAITKWFASRKQY